jgi:hypothetical protein
MLIFQLNFGGYEKYGTVMCGSRGVKRRGLFDKKWKIIRVFE